MSSDTVVAATDEPSSAPAPSKWRSRGFWAIADQGLFAGSNFIVNMLLAKWLSEADYGGLTYGYYVFLLLATIHNGLIVEPMLVFGVTKFKDRLPGYMKSLLHDHWLIAGAIGLAMIGGAGLCAAFAPDARVITFVALIVVGPSILFLWVMRRACYVRLNPKRAAQAGAVYFVLLLAPMYVVYKLGALSILWALLIMGGSSLICAIGLLIADRISYGRSNETIYPEMRREHWQYGKWATVTGITEFVVGSFYLMALPYFTNGLEGTASFRAMSNMTLPVLQTVQALWILLLPMLAHQRGTPAFDRTKKLALLALGGGPLLYWMILGPFHRQLVQLAYHGKFIDAAPVLWILGLHPAIVGVMYVLKAILLAYERTSDVFYATIISAVITVISGIVLMHRYQLKGACIALVGNYVLFSIMLWLSIRRGVKSKTPVPELENEMPMPVSSALEEPL